MAYTTIDDPSAYFQTALYTGNGGTQSITNNGNSDLQPDWIWIKSRNEAEHHNLVDSVRGNTKVVYSSLTGVEDTTSIQVTSFASDGFALGSGTNTNKNTITYAAWQWKAGTSFSNDASSTSVGSIDSAGSVSTAAGFSIISYTGTGANATIAHGLGVAPSMIITKSRGTTNNWGIYNKNLGNTNAVFLNLTNASDAASTYWNNTSPTSSVFSVGSAAGTNPSATMIAYCFAEKKGYSKFGSYTGNGNANGTFVYTGFKPAFFLLKNSSSAGSWVLVDAKRPGFNVINDSLNTNNANVENTATVCDFTSNGVKLRTNADHMNGSYTFIFMAFAENPFVTSTGVPAMAR